MVDIPLTSGAYSAQSLIANAQRCVNLYPEKNPADSKPRAPVTHYPRPGLTLLSSPPVPGRGRCLYGATDGTAWAVIDQAVYYIDADFKFNLMGLALATASENPAFMADNGQDILLVDGSAQGYDINLTTRIMTQVGDPNFSGADRVDFLDSFLLFNQLLNGQQTPNFGSTLSNKIAFNGLFFGTKTAWPDNVIAVICVGREVWIIGPKKGEVWYNAGSVPFPFNVLPGIIIEQGCAAKYSVAKMDTNLYWLSQSPEGDRMVLKGNNQHVAMRISTHAIEKEFRSYPRIDDAIGATYQISGHSFYKLHFPTADKTWGYDQATEQWHEDSSIDNNGVFHRSRVPFTCFAYGRNLGLDWQTGQLYQIDPSATTDNGQPIAWIRSFPHVVDELKQISITAFVADVETGTVPNTSEDDSFVSPWSLGFSSGFGPITKVAAPQISLRVSKNGGYTFGNNRLKGLLSSGHYRSMQRWRGIGMGRDLVFELSSTAQMVAALNGGFFTPMESGS